MTITFEPFHPRHVEYIKPSAVQTDEWQMLLTPEATSALVGGIALSVWRSGECLGAAGVTPVWPGRAEAWALFSDNVGFRVMRACVLQMKSVLRDQHHKRVDMLVRKGNWTGHRLARAAGFDFECILEAYHVTGDDMYMYKRIRK